MYSPAGVGVAAPQSNQRGIETSPDELVRILISFRLNRTSVGLKPHMLKICVKVSLRPQSNQRGIET